MPLEQLAAERANRAVVAAVSPEGRMKPVNLTAQLATAEIELACLKIALTQVKEDHDELRQERDDWRGEAEICAERLIAAKLREADERHVAPPGVSPMVASPRARLDPSA
jgi:hypothetical protein